MGSLVRGVIGFLTISYPIAVFYGIKFLEPWQIALILLLVLFVRLLTMRVNQKWNRLILLLGLIYCVFALWSNNMITLKFYPVLISFSFFVVFLQAYFTLHRLLNGSLDCSILIYLKKGYVILEK